MSLRYLRPRQLSAALEALADWRERARLLAGGTDLLVRMRQGVIEPEVIVDLSALQELRGIRRDHEAIWVGALTTYHEIERFHELATWAPVLQAACRELGAPQIRTRGTIGGNLGNASPAGDSIPPLYVLDAEVLLASVQGERWVPITGFFTGPGQTVRRPEELIQGVRFRPFEEGEQGYFFKIGQRRGMFIAKVSVAATMRLEGNQVANCRLALGAVAPTVIRVPSAEQFLAGHALTPAAMREAAQLAAEASRPITDIRSTAWYRRRLVAVLVERGLGAMAHMNRAEMVAGA